MSYGDSANPFMGDYRVALIRNPKVDLAVAVAASSAFPPFLSPAVLKLNPADFDPTTNAKGLGMKIADVLAKQLGGSFSAGPNPAGRGACFAVSFPC